MRENPLRRIRRSHNLTQKEVAIGAGITPQVVLKAEQGLYGMVPPRLISVLSEISEIGEKDLEERYKKWQAEKRLESRAEVLSKLCIPTGGISYGEFRRTVAGSTNAFCRLLCLHPAQWTRLEKHGGEDSFFVEALKEAELEWLTRSITSSGTLNSQSA